MLSESLVLDRIKVFSRLILYWLRERYSVFFEALTDGSISNCEQRVAAGTFYFKELDNSGAVRPPVFKAKLDGILLALNKCLALTKQKEMYC